MATNTQQRILFSSAPTTGSFILGLVDAAGNACTTDFIKGTAKARSNTLILESLPGAGAFTITCTLTGTDQKTDFISTDGTDWPAPADIKTAFNILGGLFLGIVVTGGAGIYDIAFPDGIVPTMSIDPIDNSTGVTIDAISSVQAELSAVQDSTAGNYPYTDVYVGTEISSLSVDVAYGYYSPYGGNPSSGGVLQALPTLAFNSTGVAITFTYFSSIDPLATYYADLLVIQYVGKPKAHGTVEATANGIVMDQLPLQVQAGFNLLPTVQTLQFSGVAAAGDFTLSYINQTIDVAWNSTLSDLQAAANYVFGYGNCVVSGSIASQNVVFSFTSNLPSPVLLGYASGTLVDNTSTPIVLSPSSNVAQGVQLDVLGKYAGVSRSGFGTNGPVTLNDNDFYRLIQLAIITNNFGSSLATINTFLHAYFPNEILVFDYSNTTPMRMGYYINTSLGSQDLVQLFIAEGLLPKPMGIQLGIAGGPTITDFFGLIDYYVGAPTAGLTPFTCNTTYDSSDYNTTYVWLDYNNAL